MTFERDCVSASNSEKPVLPLAVRVFFVTFFDAFYCAIFFKTKKWGLDAPMEMNH